MFGDDMGLSRAEQQHTALHGGVLHEKLHHGVVRLLDGHQQWRDIAQGAKRWLVVQGQGECSAVEPFYPRWQVAQRRAIEQHKGLLLAPWQILRQGSRKAHAWAASQIRQREARVDTNAWRC